MNHVANEKESTYMNTIEVKVNTLNNIIGEMQPTLIKIDVEGFETNVVSGADKILSNEKVEAVIMELNGSGDHYGFSEEDLHRRMLDYGFKTFIYSPFNRTLISLNEQKMNNGNTLYLRNLDRVTERLLTAPTFFVNNQHI